MKYNLIALTLALLVLLAGCAERREDPSDPPTGGESAQSVDEDGGDLPEADEDPAREIPDGLEVYRPVRHFGARVEDLLPEFDTYMQQGGYAATSSLESQVTESEAPGEGSYSTRSYTIGESAALMFSETLDDGAVFSVMLTGSTDEMDADTYDEVQHYMLAMLEVFSANPDSVLSQLDLESTDNNFGMVTDGGVIFNYMAASGMLMLSVDPVA